METNNIDLLEAYVNGTLTPEAQIQVENRLRTDDAFRQDYEMYQLMVSAIAENRKAELKNYIRTNVKIKPVQFFRTPTFYAAAAASVFLCILSYFVIYKKINEKNEVAQSETKDANKEQPIAYLADTTRTQTSTANTSPPPPPIIKDIVVTTPDTKATVEDNDQNVTMSDAKDSDDNSSRIQDLSNKPEEIKVEGDKMMSDSFLLIPRKIYIAKPKQYQTSPTDLFTVITTGDKLKIEVQFWQSPINYTGYRLNKNLLLIYGKFDPSQASFQELKDVIYMKHKNEYYKFVPGETFSSMRKETDAKIIGELETK